MITPHRICTRSRAANVVPQAVAHNAMLRSTHYTDTILFLEWESFPVQFPGPPYQHFLSGKLLQNHHHNPPDLNSNFNYVLGRLVIVEYRNN